MDKIDTIKAFASVAVIGSFNGAADRLGISTALVSKYVSRLEDRLGARLLNRTTRSLSLTEIGEIYLQRCLLLLDDFEELDNIVHEQSAQARGTIRITAPRTLGEIILASAVSDFLNANPEVNVLIDLNDRLVDIVEEGFDLAIRVGALDDSSYFARRIAHTSLVTCASKQYLETYGIPETPQDLLKHQCILDTNRKLLNRWQFIVEGQQKLVEVHGRMRVNSAVAVREAILCNAGIALTPLFAIASEVQKGEIVPILASYNIPNMQINAIYPHNRHLPQKVRLFVDFLVARYSKNNAWGLYPA